MNLIGRFVFQRQVRPPRVVEVHRLPDHLSCLRDIFWFAEQVFRFEYPVYPFRQRVLVTVIPVRHRAGDAISLM